jgi:hypothetical protein
MSEPRATYDIDAVVDRFEQSRSELDRLRGTLDGLDAVATKQDANRAALGVAAAGIESVAEQLRSTAGEFQALLAATTELIGSARDAIAVADTPSVLTRLDTLEAAIRSDAAAREREAGLERDLRAALGALGLRKAKALGLG